MGQVSAAKVEALAVKLRGGLSAIQTAAEELLKSQDDYADAVARVRVHEVVAEGRRDQLLARRTEGKRRRVLVKEKLQSSHT